MEEESAFVKSAYERLERMREQARGNMADVMDIGRGGTFQARAERDVVVRTSLARLESLDVGDQALVFGRIDFADPGSAFGEPAFHIGRLSVNSADMEPLVVDWRAPVAEAFYRATGKDPMGLWRRRHLLCEGESVIGLEDEILDRPEQMSPIATEGEVELDLIGPGALFAAISRPRTEHMRDMVSTIQSEQDAIIRSPLPGILVVQGAPGTGKTAVALHRAAYILYTHRWRFERQGLLVVGPSFDFVRYIQHVLPSLGESGVELHTVEGLTGFAVRAVERDGELARIKGDARMALMLKKAVRDRERPLRREVEIPFGARYIKVPVELTQDVTDWAKRRRGSHNHRRKMVESRLADLLARAYVAGSVLVREMDAQSNIVSISALSEKMAGEVQPGEEEEDVLREVTTSLRRSYSFQKVVERIWPHLTPELALTDLLTHLPLLKLAGKRYFPEEDLVLLHDGDVASRGWTKEEVVLLDELRPLLDGDSEESETYGHVVIDEAQDLTPMAARLLARRCPQGSMTILGDLAQAFGPFSGRGWDEVTAPLRGSKPFEMVELSINYRTPESITELANRVRSRYAADAKPSRAIRRGDSDVVARTCTAETRDAVLLEMVEEEARAIGGGMIGVITSAEGVGHAKGVLHHLDTEGTKTDGVRVTVVDIAAARGLEFDSVIVVEPLELLPQRRLAERALYVAATRSTRRLAFLSTDSLPDWLYPTNLS